MVEQADGHRVLLAPTSSVAEVIGALYRFDETAVAAVGTSRARDRIVVTGPDLHLELVVGARTALGRLLRMVPPRLAVHPAWLRAVDPVARLVLHGVRTVGRSRDGRAVSYGVTDLHAVTALSGRWRGTELGRLAPIEPPVRFGFGSTPPRPACSRVVTTVRASRGA